LIDDVNVKTCLHRDNAGNWEKQNNDGCDISRIVDELSCPETSGYTIELFNREEPSTRRRLDQIR